MTTRVRGRSRGVLRWNNLGSGVGDDPGAVAANWAEVCRAAGRDPATLVRVHQVHGDAVCVAGRTVRPGQQPRPRADAIVTDRGGDTLAVIVADCAPVFLADAAAGVVGLAHAGWRGALAGVAARTVEAMAGIGAEPSRVEAWIGPRICPRCYEVDEELAARFDRRYRGRRVAWPGRAGKAQLDLSAAIAASLEEAGVASRAIRESPLCTSCRTDLFYSHRAEGGRTGRFAALLWIEGGAVLDSVTSAG